MLLAGPISHTSTQYIDFVAFYISLDLSTILLILVGAELPLCVVVTLSQNSVSCFSGVKLNIRSFVLFHIYCCLFLSPLCVLFILMYAKCNMHGTLLFLSSEGFCLSTQHTV